jgi:hypothetical protein
MPSPQTAGAPVDPLLSLLSLDPLDPLDPLLSPGPVSPELEPVAGGSPVVSSVAVVETIVSAPVGPVSVAAELPVDVVSSVSEPPPDDEQPTSADNAHTHARP